MSLNIIAAVGIGNHVIGANNDLPWSKIPRDMKHFKDTTMGHHVVMGRKTWDSLPEVYRPLPGRKNIVLTRKSSLLKINKGPVIIHENINLILEVAKAEEEVFVIGGAEIYKLFMSHAQTLHLTFVHGEFKGDVYFPEVSLRDWFESTKRKSDQVVGDPYPLTFCTFSRKQKIA